MKTIIGIFTALLILNTNYSNASNCSITKINGGGFTTTIESVVNNCNSTYTISLIVTHNGASGPSNKALSHFSVQALPGSYSNVSLTVLTGNMNYTAYVPGPNLGSDPFEGFKFDGTTNIGDGKAGSFRVTYTLSGNLQNQMVSCKAGTNGQIVKFTINDFEYVRDCNNTNCNNIADTDGDGCNDNVDMFPFDSTECSENYFPVNNYATLLFEDLWPAKGDYDFNDLVINYKFKTITNSNNFVKDIYATFIIKAFGASYHNGFGFQIGNANIPVFDINVTGYKLSEGYINLNSNGTEAGQSIPTIIVFDNAYKLMPYPGFGIGVNTTPGAPYVTPDTVRIKISFTQNKYTENDIKVMNFNPFLIVNKNRGLEVHLADYKPTDLAYYSLLGTVEDNSMPNLNRYYKTVKNHPWALNINDEIDHMIEKIDFVRGYLKFATWAESNGNVFKNWFIDLPGHIDHSKLYKKQ